MAIRRIGVLTGGGDAPGLNPAIRALVWKAAEEGVETVGIYDGWRGMMDGAEDPLALDVERVRYWDLDGGTHLGSSRTNPFNHKVDGQRIDASEQVMRNFERLRLDALVPIGGEDTLGVAAKLAKKGAPVVGIPKTIDKDLGGTDYTLGFDTSLRTCVDIIERSRTPAGSHHWVQIVEVMGRHAGHLALWSGLAGGAYITLIPEAPFEVEKVLKLLDERLSKGKKDRRLPRYAVVVVAEGALPAGGGEVTLEQKVDAFGHARLGGIGAWLSEQIRQKTPWDSRAVALGHPQRGGTPSPIDRIMGHLFGSAAVEACMKGTWGKMVSARGIAPACHISLVSLDEATKGLNLVDVAHHYNLDRYQASRAVLD
ncbi:MAG TPA: ATP-dependent 6-phosphofructokinase [Polyangia bacterium]|jgi:6-phosphofructokinase 1